MEVFDPATVCRLCVADLTQFKECYLIEGEIDCLVTSLTTISFQDVDAEEKDNLMLCINCYDNLKSFDEYKAACIKNQEKFKHNNEFLKNEANTEREIEIIVDTLEEEGEDLIEYITEENDGEDEDHEEEEEEENAQEQEIFDDSMETVDTMDQDVNDSEVVMAVENIIEYKKEKAKPVIVDKKQIIENKPKKVEHKDPARNEKGKEMYQKLLQQCPKCDKMVEKNRMEGHINKHNENRAFKCPECNKGFYCRQLLRLHRNSLHTNIQIQCNICDKVFPSARALYSHQLRHKNRDRYKCELCDKAFNNTNSLKRHSAVHSGIRDYICGVCGIGFYRKFNLDTHIKNVHQEIKDYECSVPECRKKFGYARLLRDHMRKHHLESPMKAGQQPPLFESQIEY